MDVISTLQWLQSHEVKDYALLGFDAFLDRICHHASGLGSEKMQTMTELGQKLVDRCEHSGLIAMNQMETRLGGNMPNTANVLSELGAPVSCIGAFGLDKIDRTFAGLAKKCRIKSYADPGTCLAIEFNRCKLFLGDNGSLDDITWETIVERVGMEYIMKQFEGARLIGLFNWGELKSTQGIWEALLRDVLPELKAHKRDFFIDFSDMSGREQEEIDHMLETLRRFRDYGRVIVSLNSGEKDTLDYNKLVSEGYVDALILHAAKEAVLMTAEERWTLGTRFIDKPVLLTGGGDSFNGGFCWGMLYELPLEDCLKTANATAGCYVRYGHAPDKQELLDEISKCKEIWN